MNRRNFLLTPGVGLALLSTTGIARNWLQTTYYRSCPSAPCFEYIQQAVGGFKPECLILLGARPCMGKTTLVSGIGNYLAKTQMYSVAHITASNSSNEIHSVKYRDSKLRHVATRTTRELIEKHCYMFSEELSGLDLITIDNMNVFCQYNENPTQAKKLLNWIKKLSIKLQTSIIITANLNQEIVERVDHRPRVSDLTFANQLPSQVDAVIFLYRDEIYQDSCTANSDHYALKGITEVSVINA